MICYPDTTNWGDHVWPDPLLPADLLKKELAEALAWTTLWTLTGHQLSLCPITVRPFRRACSARSYMVGPLYSPYIGLDGSWYNHVAGCECNSVNEVILPGPIGGLVSVVIDGVAVDPDVIRVDDFNRLVRQDGIGWPLKQDMNLPAGDVGTFIVTYFRGAPPDELDNYAAGVLAEEYWKAANGDAKCRLPKNVISIARQGVTYQMDATSFENGLTGIREVDPIIARRNPYRLKTPSVVLSPDTKRTRQTTIGAGQTFGSTPSGLYGLVPDLEHPGYWIVEAA